MRRFSYVLEHIVVYIAVYIGMSALIGVSFFILAIGLEDGTPVWNSGAGWFVAAAVVALALFILLHGRFRRKGGTRRVARAFLESLVILPASLLFLRPVLSFFPVSIVHFVSTGTLLLGPRIIHLAAYFILMIAPLAYSGYWGVRLIKTVIARKTAAEEAE